jgi:hypothetical protein
MRKDVYRDCDNLRNGGDFSDKEKLYQYWISYYFQSDTGHGPGGIDITKSERIKSPSDIDEIAELIKGKFGYSSVVIFGWTLFE